MIPGWKIRRELSRLGQQLRAIPEAVWEPFAQRAHDAALERGFPEITGALPLGPRVALVLCWQPQGLAASFFDMLDHLVNAGYVPFVVSNAALSAQDRQTLHPRIWRAVERPNFGYDFGGYRDGLTMLRRWGVRPDRLVILNDSVWFPVWPGDRTLERAEAAPFDVVGSILRQRDRSCFLESYFFSIRGSTLDHPGFCIFWDTLRLTSNKYKVIRRGERGFGEALQAAGISMGPLFATADFEAALHHADQSTLRQMLHYMASTDPNVTAMGARIADLPDAPDWHEKALNFITNVLSKAQPYSAFPLAASRELGYPFLKKSADLVSLRWREAVLRGVDDGVLRQPKGSVLAEARARS